MPPRSAAWRMADRLTGDSLAGILTAYRSTKTPWETIARELHNTYGIVVTSETLRRWGSDLDAGTERASA